MTVPRTVARKSLVFSRIVLVVKFMLGVFVNTVRVLFHRIVQFAKSVKIIVNRICSRTWCPRHSANVLL